jgi:lysophospholipase L1-like esterase
MYFSIKKLIATLSLVSCVFSAPCYCQAIVFYDDFNRPNNAAVGNRWSESSPPASSISAGSLRLVAQNSAPAENLVYRPRQEVLLDAEASVVFSCSGSTEPWLWIRLQGQNLRNGYAAYLSASGWLSIARVKNGEITVLSSVPAAHSPGMSYLLTLRSTGGNPEVSLETALMLVDGRQVIRIAQTSAKDTSLSRIWIAGTAGLSASGTGSVVYDNFGIRDLAEESTSVPKSSLLTSAPVLVDAFNREDSDDVGAGWVERNPKAAYVRNGVLVLSSTGRRFTENILTRPPSEAVRDGEAAVRFMYQQSGSSIPMLFIRATSANTVSGYLALLHNGRFAVARLEPGASSYTTLSSGWAPLGSGWHELRLRIMGEDPVEIEGELRGTSYTGSPLHLLLKAEDRSGYRITKAGVSGVSVHSSGTAVFDDFSFSSPQSSRNLFDPNDPRISYYGRWNLINSPPRSVGVNAGIGFRARFTGPACSIRFDTSANQEPFPTIWVRVDNEWTEYILSPLINVSPQPLDPSTPHELEVVLRSVDPNQNRWLDPPTGAIYFAGLELYPGAVLLPPPPRPQITVEFIGDSITEGYANLDTRGGPEFSDVLKAYSRLTAQLLNAEPWITAFGGHGVSRQQTNSKVPKAPLSVPWIYSNLPVPNWFKADIVVINEGTNDKGADSSTFIADYVELIKVVRRIHPMAFIFCMRPFNGTNAGAISEAVSRAALSDPMLFYVDTTGWLAPSDYTDASHPNVAGHEKASRYLSAHIRAVLAQRGIKLP